MRTKVKELYKYSKTHNVPLLGGTAGVMDFWDEYLSHSSVYDRYFSDTFRSFLYWIDFEDEDTMADIYADFTEAVQSHLYVNKKRYTELYRVQVLAANAYDIVNNYDLTEETTRTNTGTVTNETGEQDNTYYKGARSRSDTINHGAQTTGDSTVYGSFTDTNQMAHGAQSESTSSTLGQQSNSDTKNIGARSSGDTIGAQTDTMSSEVAPFDSSTFNNDRRETTSHGARSDSHTEAAATDSESHTIGSRSDSASKSAQAYTDTDTHTHGTHTDTNAHTESAYTDSESHSETAFTDSEELGERTDTRTDDLEENTTTRRRGNIGVQTAADVIGGHIKLWEMFNFYKMVFNNIAKEYLLVSDDGIMYSGETARTSDSAILSAIAALSAKVDENTTEIETKIDNIDIQVEVDLQPVRNDIAAVSGKVNIVSGKVDNVSTALGTVSGKVDTVSGKADQIQLGVNQLKASVLGIAADVQQIPVDIASMQASVIGVVNSAKADIIGEITEVSTDGY